MMSGGRIYYSLTVVPFFLFLLGLQVIRLFPVHPGAVLDECFFNRIIPFQPNGT